MEPDGGAMNDQRWQRMWDVFHEALEKNPDERKVFLDAACAGEAGLCEEVLRLLASHQRSSGILDAGPAGTVTEAAGGPDPLAGERIGPYRLLEILGEGGMGVVYTADQERPVRRRVALKLIRLGMDTKEVVARFESERQALAIMDHPRIAKVFDAGVTEKGRPYFVMEYVPGIPITEYCDLRGLPISERLALFAQACEAIEHAHRKGIIHRDIKPSNLLVAAVDGKPSLKVIDFGVAKAISQRLTERTLFTQHGILVGTPGYMSPEQAGSTPLEVDARTDIYALGVLLYELLVGALPFDPKTLRRVAAAEMLRIIREEEPPTPSVRIASLGDAAEEVAKRRHLDVHTLARQLRGELEWITMRALEKDPGRRYASASEFASDVGRYLTNEPVAAGPPSSMYRLSKFVRRHRVGVLTAAAFTILAVVLGASIMLQSRLLTRALEQTAALERSSPTVATPMLSYDEETLGGWTKLSHGRLFDFSPDGKKLAFRASFGDEKGELYVSDHTGTVIRSLVDPVEGMWVRSPRWSPDGRSIAFVGSEKDASGSRKVSIYVVDAEGGTPRPVATDPTSQPAFRDLAWTPDGRQLTYLTHDGFHTMGLDGKPVRFIPMRVHELLKLDEYSPDGRWLAFSVQNADAESPLERDIWIVPAAGDAPAQRLTYAQGWDSDLTWAADGRAAYFVSERSGSSNIWKLALDPETGQRQSEPEQVTFYSDARLLHPRVIDRGRKMALVLSKSRNAIRVGDSSGPETARPLVRGRKPVLSPEGNTVCFRGEGPGEEGIFAVSVEGGTPRRLTASTPATAFGRGFDLSPDGESIALFVRESDEFALLTVPLLGGKPRRLLRVGTNDEAKKSNNLAPVFSPDGDRLAYAFGSQLFVIPSAGGEPRTIAHLWGWDEWTLRWSPDGNHIAALGWTGPSQQNAVFVVPSSGGEPRRLTAPDKAYKWMLQWHPGGQRLTFADDDAGRVRQAFLDGRPSEVMIDYPGVYLYEGSWSPDGRRYFVEGATQQWELYAYDDETGEISPFSSPFGGSVRAGMPTWSRDGRRMAWTTSENVVQLWTMEKFR